jgi:SNF family Na+-dependent transporter
VLSLFVGWFLAERISRDEMETGGGPFRLYGLWKFLLRFVCPIAIGWILVAVVQGKAFNLEEEPPPPAVVEAPATPAAR